MRTWSVEQKLQEFTDFYTSAEDGCLRIVLASVGDPELAEDLVAEAFTQAWGIVTEGVGHPVPRARVVRSALNAGSTCVALAVEPRDPL